MNKTNYIKQRLSLREPLKESLDILEQICNNIKLTKDFDLTQVLKKIEALYPTCTDFERDFPSISYSIATGVGKTRLMGACIAYLYLQKGIKNFFVLAPNLTIYNKLIQDFGNPGYEKYVFRGIAEFVHNPPYIIHGNNYQNFTGMVRQDTVHINVFNISKFNRDATSPIRGKEKGTVPRIKRLNENLGDAYFQYLSKMDDLVILMDEAHRYRADASMKAINELKPIFGIELTATPIDEKGNIFKNVVYEYSLAKALEDGKYVKNPAIATRKNFKSQGRTTEEIEKIKLEDAISIHEDTKAELEIYARTNGVEKVKPFILVVCKDTTHAKQVFDYVNSNDFYRGAYNGKALQIDSTTKKEEVEAQFLTLEHPDNDIEIVIHVNMLKEGWDVKNLYTIVPLRAANAAVLIEQTIGRGLRLPFNGERTGVDKVDKLTVLAHDNFHKVIEEAQNPDSVLNKMSIVEISEEDLKTKSTPVVSPTVTQIHIQKEEKKIEAITNKEEKQEARNTLDAKRLIITVLNDPEVAIQTKGLHEYDKPAIKAKVIQKAKERLNTGQLNLYKKEIEKEIDKVYEPVLVDFKNNTIEIPRIDLVQDDVEVWFEDFNLDTSGFSFEMLNEEIQVRGLVDNNIDTIGVRQGAFAKDTPVNQIISELINSPEVDYDENADLLHKLATQAVKAIETQKQENENLRVLIRQYRKVISGRIYDQLKENFRMSKPKYSNPNVLPFRKIEEWNFTAMANGYKDYRMSVTPVNTIPKYVFTGFEKACHLEYKFDSKTEKDFAFVLENDQDVIKWLRPAPNQFRIYWANNAKQYHPDFVVETADAIYLVETKAENEITSADVQAKKNAALVYCNHATDFTQANGGKPWKYLLIPHNDVSETSSINYLISNYTINN